MKYQVFSLRIVARYGQVILQGIPLDNSNGDDWLDVAFLHKEDVMRLGKEFLDSLESAAQFYDY